MAAARLTTVSRIGALATDKRADAIVVAGDVFDAPSIADKTIRRLFSALDSFSGPWILIPGNHDAALSAGVWERAADLGCIADHVRVLTRPEVVEMRSLSAAFLGAPLAQRNSFSDLTAAFDQLPSEPGFYRIGVAHGSVTGLLQGDLAPGNPISPDRVSLARLDYLALGDWHGMKQVNPRMWYSGTPEQDRFRANDPGYVLEVSIEEPGAQPQVQSHKVSQYQWHDIEAVLQGDTAIDALSHQMKDYAQNDVVRLAVSGSVTLAQRRALDQLTGSLEARLGAFRSDFTALSLSASDEDIAGLQADGYLAEVLEELRGDNHQLDEAVRQEALRLLADTLTATVETSNGRDAG